MPVLQCQRAHVIDSKVTIDTLVKWSLFYFSTRISFKCMTIGFALQTMIMYESQLSRHPDGGQDNNLRAQSAHDLG